LALTYKNRLTKWESCSSECPPTRHPDSALHPSHLCRSVRSGATPGNVRCFAISPSLYRCAGYL